MAARRCSVVVIGLLLGTLASVLPVHAESRILFDFEDSHIYEPGRTIKDHSMVFDGSLWHCFYIRGTEGVSGTASETELGHATSPDLRHWDILDPALTVTDGDWDGRNVWAPHVATHPGGGWRMFYTGVENNWLQRAGQADSSDLDSWSKLAPLGILEPDSLVYMWSPDLEVPQLSAFRDPFYFEKNGQHHILNTALVEDVTVGVGRRGVIHHYVSNDFSTWTEIAPLATNTHAVGAWRELESVQLIEYGGSWHLFFTFFGLSGIRWVSNPTLENGWDLSTAVLIDLGTAAEVTPLGGDDFLLTRHSADVHGPHADYPGGLFFALKADTLRFSGPGSAPMVVPNSDISTNWPDREGTAFLAMPTFGNNIGERQNFDVGLRGNGYLSSLEFYAGPFSQYGYPGQSLGNSATGRITSRPFTIAADDSAMIFLVGGTDGPLTTVSLIEITETAPSVFDTTTHRTTTGLDRQGLGLAQWDIRNLRGKTLRMQVVDADSAGFIHLDHVRIMTPSSPVVDAPAANRRERARLLTNRPNPFNPRTEIRWALNHDMRTSLHIYSLSGRLMRSVTLGDLPSGSHSWVWDGRDARGAEVSSGVYLVQLRSRSESLDSQKITLIR